MAARYTLKNLAAVEDAAARFGYGDAQESRFATKDLEAERTGVGYHRVKPGKRLDAIRVAPDVTRNFEAGPDGLELLAFGARHEGDGEIIPGWWTDDADG